MQGWLKLSWPDVPTTRRDPFHLNMAVPGPWPSCCRHPSPHAPPRNGGVSAVRHDAFCLAADAGAAGNGNRSFCSAPGSCSTPRASGRMLGPPEHKTGNKTQDRTDRMPRYVSIPHYSLDPSLPASQPSSEGIFDSCLRCSYCCTVPHQTTTVIRMDAMGPHVTRKPRAHPPLPSPPEHSLTRFASGIFLMVFSRVGKPLWQCEQKRARPPPEAVGSVAGAGQPLSLSPRSSVTKTTEHLAWSAARLGHLIWSCQHSKRILAPLSLGSSRPSMPASNSLPSQGWSGLVEL